MDHRDGSVHFATFIRPSPSIEYIGRYARASDEMETRGVEEFERFGGEGKE